MYLVSQKDIYNRYYFDSCDIYHDYRTVISVSSFFKKLKYRNIPIVVLDDENIRWYS